MSYLLTYGLNWIIQGEPPHPVRMVSDILRAVEVSVGDMTCDAIHDEIVDMTVEQADTSDGVVIRELVHISTTKQGLNEVACIGRATPNTGQTLRVAYSKRLAADGMYWFAVDPLD